MFLRPVSRFKSTYKASFGSPRSASLIFETPLAEGTHSISFAAEGIRRGELEHSPPLQRDSPLDGNPQKGLLDLNSLLFEQSLNNLNQEAVKTFLRIRQSHASAESSTFSCILKVCSSLSDNVLGKQVHASCFKCGWEINVSVGTALVDFYMKSGNVEDGRQSFDEMPERNVVSWTTLLTGYTQNGFAHLVLGLFFEMQIEGIKPNRFTFSSVLTASAAEGAIEKGIQAHAQVIKLGHQSTVFVCNSLMNMYWKSGYVEEAKAVFDSMECKDAVSWNVMIAGFVQNGLDEEGLKLFHQMRIAGMKLTQLIFATAIKLCANLKELNFGRQLHCHVIKNGYGIDINIRTTLMLAYSRCGEMDSAFDLFSTMSGVQNVVSWTALISGYIQNGEVDQAVHLFCQMRKSVSPNDYTYSTILTACPVISPFQVHAQVIKTNYRESLSVATALMGAYLKVGSAHEASNIFKQLDVKDIVAWSAMLAGFAQAKDSEGAVKLFKEMVQEGIQPNEYTLSSVINACSSPTAAVEQGKQLHASSIKSGFDKVICVGSAIVTMYAKRGNIQSAHEVFKRQKEKDLVAWNSMITGYAQHGYGKKALDIYNELEKEGLDMDSITFIGVITACTHVGLVDEGQKCFSSMVKDHQIKPTMEHYACMVDLYSRAGKLQEAMKLITEMPFPAGGTVWRTLLGACRVHRNLELGKLAADKLILLDPQDSAAYVLLSNIYAAEGKWEERGKVRKLMADRKVKKEAGYSWIEIRNRTHSFLASDRSHPLTDKIYLKLEEMAVQLKDVGYKPDTTFVLHDVEEEQKVVMLSQHSERLAIAFGLIVTPQGAQLQIVKNLRVCGDCHTFIKLMSKIEGREIVVRDSNRFHHFKEGLCSCGDYW
ncbi:pentatricopeptide repeat-containing protein At2g27610-like [Aristolochia californica]|uniref:pentatricopeptide repeat-containing protein At2g27610-like n=1 Tax=Aristolochia californica TaxID=171875 RepID=UPI0035DB7332